MDPDHLSLPSQPPVRALVRSRQRASQFDWPVVVDQYWKSTGQLIRSRKDARLKSEHSDNEARKTNP